MTDPRMYAELFAAASAAKKDGTIDELNLDILAAKSLYYKGKYQAALHGYEQILELRPELDEIWLRKSLCFAGLKDYEKAIESIDRAIQINQNVSEYWAARNSYLEELGRYEEALSNVEKALELDTKNASIWVKKGVTLLKLRRFEESIGCFDMAVGINSTSNFAWRYRGVSLSAIGRYKSALLSYKKALEINPKDSWVREEIEKLVGSQKQIEIGQDLLQLYRVDKLLGEGTFGKVYKVFHLDRNSELAVKEPRYEVLEEFGGVESFEREAEDWINLGLHPNVVSCYYVRRWDETPLMFVEYVAGGSLKDWIESRRLYEGSDKEALKRILDIAIQFAWGLHHAHEQGLIHKDVKPGNVMMTPDGVVKVTDFGLAKAQTTPRNFAQQKAEMTVVAKGEGFGYTPAYCAPEQPNHSTLTRRTDLWGWGTTILHMFAGTLFWCGEGHLAQFPAGILAREALEASVTGETVIYKPFAIPIEPPQQIKVSIPDALVEILKQCFQEEEKKRPRSLKIVANQLKQIYRQVIGEDYPRSEPIAADLLADDLSNRAISLLDLGKQEEAREKFEQAFKSDPCNLTTAYNRGLILWRCGKLMDLELVNQLENFPVSPGEEWRQKWMLGQVHLERGDLEAAQQALEESSQAKPDSPEVKVAQRRLKMLREQGRGYLGEGDPIAKIDQEKESRIQAFAVSSDDNHLSIAVGTSQGVVQVEDTNYQRRTKQSFVLRFGKKFRNGYFDPSQEPDEPDQSIKSLAFSPDGQHLAIGMETQVRLFLNFQSKKTTHKDEWGYFKSVSYLQKQGKPRHLIIFELGEESKEKYQDIGFKTNPVTFSLDSKQLFMARLDTSLVCIDLESGEITQIFRGHKSFAKSLDISPDGKQLVSAGSSNNEAQIFIWDIQSGEMTKSISCTQQRAEHMVAAYFYDREHVLAGSQRKLALWHILTGECRKTFKLAQGVLPYLCSLSISKSKKFAFAACIGRSQLWDVSTGKVLRTYDELNGVQNAAIADERIVALNFGRFSDRFAILFLPETRKSLAPFAISERSLDQEFFKNTLLAKGLIKDVDKKIHSSNFGDALVTIRKLRGIAGYERNDEVRRLNRIVGLSCRPQKLRSYWKTKQLEGHTRQITTLDISPDSRFLVSGSWDGFAACWDISTGDCLSTFGWHEGDVVAVAIAPNGSYAVTSARDGLVRVWSLPKGEFVCQFDLRQKKSFFKPITLEGYEIRSGSEPLRNKFVVPPIFATTEQQRVGQIHSFAIPTISPDSRYVLTSNGNTGIGLWDVLRGRLLSQGDQAKELWNHIRAISISLSGNNINESLWKIGDLEGLKGKKVEAQPGKFLSALDFERPGRIAAISPDSRWIVEGFQDGHCQVYELDWDYEFPGWSDFVEETRPFLKSFLHLHTPYASELPKYEDRSFEELKASLTRSGTPSWSEEDFNYLIHVLRQAGYGWIRPDSVQQELEKMAGIAPPQKTQSSKPTANTSFNSGQRTVQSDPVQNRPSPSVNRLISPQNRVQSLTRQRQRPALLTFLASFTGLSIILKSAFSFSWLLTIGTSFAIAILLALLIHRLTSHSQKKVPSATQPQAPQPISQEKINAYRDLLLTIINSPDDMSAAKALVADPHLITPEFVQLMVTTAHELAKKGQSDAAKRLMNLVVELAKLTQ